MNYQNEMTKRQAEIIIECIASHGEIDSDCCNECYFKSRCEDTVPWNIDAIKQAARILNKQSIRQQMAWQFLVSNPNYQVAHENNVIHAYRAVDTFLSFDPDKK